MNLLEYQSKELFRSYGIPVPDGKVAFSADEAVAAAESLTTDRVVVKAQVHGPRVQGLTEVHGFVGTKTQVPLAHRSRAVPGLRQGAG